MPWNVKPCNGFEFPHTSSRLAITASHFVHLLVEQRLLRKCIFAVLWQNPIILSSVHQIFILMYSTVSIEPSCIMGFLHVPPLQRRFPTFHDRTSSLIHPHDRTSCFLPIISSLEPSKKLKSKFINSPPEKRSWITALEFWLTNH